MATARMSAIALVLSAVTLVVVLIVAARVVPQATDSGPALSALQYDISEMQANIAALRSIAERPPATPNPITDPIAAMQARFDSLDAAVGAIATKFATLCTAINSSPFAPSGGAC